MCKGVLLFYFTLLYQIAWIALNQTIYREWKKEIKKKICCIILSVFICQVWMNEAKKKGKKKYVVTTAAVVVAIAFVYVNKNNIKHSNTYIPLEFNWNSAYFVLRSAPLALCIIRF